MIRIPIPEWFHFDFDPGTRNLEISVEGLMPVVGLLRAAFMKERYGR